MIEIQIHPSDIRRKVRYFFFGRKSVALAVCAATLLLGLVIVSMAAAPSVIRRAYKVTYLRMMRQERAIQAGRLREHVDQMSSLERILDAQRLKVEKLVAVYGLDRVNLGQGGLMPASSLGSLGSDNEEIVDASRREKQLEQALAILESQLDLLARYERENAELIRHIPSILPVSPDQFVLTSPYGTRISPFTRVSDFHKGLDLAAPTGTPIYAAADGVVTFSGRYPLSHSVAWWRFGNVVVLNHADRFITIYAHCDTTAVQPGQTVRQGEVIGTVGSTGWSTNSHLHYEVRTDLKSPGMYEPVDPRIYILNYQWPNEAKLLKSRAEREKRSFDPLPATFIGRRRA